MTGIAANLGARSPKPLPPAHFPDAGPVLSQLPAESRPRDAVDVLLVNPPSPDGGIWIRSQHRVGRRSRENMIWPQIGLAQMAALLDPDYTVEIIDAIPSRMSWQEFHGLLAGKRPRYYLTQVAAPTLTNDLRGVFLARSLGATTIAFGTHVTPLPVPTMKAFPALDYLLRGEPELTLRELLDSLEDRVPSSPQLLKLFQDHDPDWLPPAEGEVRDSDRRSRIKGLVWRAPGGEIRINADRPYIRNLDDLPFPLHHLLPWEQYRAPNIRGPYTFVVTSRGCPAGCTFCIKHVNYQSGVRVRSPQNVLDELRLLQDLPAGDGSRRGGVRNVHMYADLFTVSRDQVMGICQGIIDQGLDIRWTCNSRVDFVDPEMLQVMARSGCWLISWGIESASEQVRQRARKGITAETITQALQWSRAAGIMNWGYFIIGLPGETEDTIRQTIDLSKQLPLDLALFHIAAPYPGTPLFFDVVENGWFRPGAAWEEIDMDESTVLEYPDLPAERIEYWARRAFREWAMRPGPIWTFLKSMNNWPAAKSAINVGWQALGWMR